MVESNVVFLPSQQSVDQVLQHLRAAESLQDAEWKTVEGAALLERPGMVLRVDVVTRLRPVMAKANAFAHRRRETRECAMVASISYELDTSAYTGTLYEARGEVGPVLFQTPWEAVSVVECLAKLPGAIALDSRLEQTARA